MYLELATERRKFGDEAIRKTTRTGAARSTNEPPAMRGYRISLSKRWLMEKPFGWMKQTQA
jgi:hypothetical protein